MKTVFLAVLRLCREAGLVKLGLVALDGTKVQGNASLEANRTAASIEAEIEKMLAEAEATDAKEDSQSATQQGAALPKALARRAERLARLRKCKEKLERRAAAAAARQQAKIDATEAEEQAAGRRKRGRKPKAADPSIDPGDRLHPAINGSAGRASQGIDAAAIRLGRSRIPARLGARAAQACGPSGSRHASGIFSAH